MEEKISILLDHITCLDACEVWVDDSSDDYVQMEGFSKMVSVEVFGPVDEKEQVIIDFGEVKKVLKGLIDDPVKGFDHKLLLTQSLALKPTVELDYEEKDGKVRQIVVIRNPHREHQVAFKIKGDSGFLRIYQGTLKQALEEYLTRELREMYECEALDVKVYLNSKAVSSDNKYRAYFNYMHGLAHSSSWGCQNMLHGHTSWVQAIDDQGCVNVRVSDLIAEYLDGNYLVHDIHMVEVYLYDHTPEKVKYTSEDRGKWVMKLPGHYIFPLDDEPTIENIVAHVAEQWEEEFEENNIIKLVISEGLTKAGTWYGTPKG